MRKANAKKKDKREVVVELPVEALVKVRGGHYANVDIGDLEVTSSG